MLFGEFLVEKNIITADRLLVGLIWQIEKQSSVFRILAETQLVSKKQILKIARIHWETKKDVLLIGRELALLSESQIEQIVIKQRQSRQMIGEILVEIGAISREDLDSYLLKYNEYISLVSMGGNAATKNSSAEPAAATKIGQNTRLEEIELEFSKIPWQGVDTSMAIEYADFLDVKKVGELEALLLSWERDRKADHLRSYFREIHTLKGTARFVKAFLSEKIIHKMEELISDMIRVAAFIPEDQSSKYVDILLKGLDVLTAIKEELLISLNEKDFYEVKSNKKIILSYCSGLGEMLLNCKLLEDNIDLEKLEDQF